MSKKIVDAEITLHHENKPKEVPYEKTRPLFNIVLSEIYQKNAQFVDYAANLRLPKDVDVIHLRKKKAKNAILLQVHHRLRLILLLRLVPQVPVERINYYLGSNLF
jgi:hypothetical protein